MTMAAINFSEEQIRQAVREALLEALPAGGREREKRKVVTNCALMTQILESIGNNCKTAIKVNVENNRLLGEFMRDLVKCVADKNVEAMILSNRLKFELNRPNREQSSPSTPAARAPERHSSSASREVADGRLQTGVLTESKVLALAKNNKRVVIGNKVVLTPLAKDRARTVGLEIVRQ